LTFFVEELLLLFNLSDHAVVWKVSLEVSNQKVVPEKQIQAVRFYGDLCSVFFLKSLDKSKGEVNGAEFFRLADVDADALTQAVLVGRMKDLSGEGDRRVSQRL